MRIAQLRTTTYSRCLRCALSHQINSRASRPTATMCIETHRPVPLDSQAMELTTIRKSASTQPNIHSKIVFGNSTCPYTNVQMSPTMFPLFPVCELPIHRFVLAVGLHIRPQSRPLASAESITADRTSKVPLVLLKARPRRSKIGASRSFVHNAMTSF